MENVGPESCTSSAYRRGPFGASLEPEIVAFITRQMFGEDPQPVGDKPADVMSVLSPSSRGTELLVKLPMRVTFWSDAVAVDPKLEVIITPEEVCEGELADTKLL